jgi:hypothetical protein
MLRGDPLKPLLQAQTLRALAGRTAMPTIPELVQTLWMPHRLRKYNWLLQSCPQDAQRLHDAMLRFLELSVLETRLRRLLRMTWAVILAMRPYQNQRLRNHERDAATSPDSCQALLLLHGLRQELLVRRTWNAARHSQWLAFEADSGIQVRPDQYAVAAALLRNPSKIVQLNMGLGKTRVVLPLLVLEQRRFSSRASSASTSAVPLLVP